MKLLTGMLIIGLATEVSAQVVTYDMTGNSGVTATQAVTSIDPNVSASSIARASGLTAISGADVFSSGNWNITDNVNFSDDYITFTVSANSGYELTLDSLQFRVSGSNSAPVNLVVAYSTDNFVTSTVSTAFSTTTSLVTKNWDFPNFTSISSTTITFRIQSYGSVSVNASTSSTAGTIKFDDIVLNGTIDVAAVPEPSTYAAILGAVALIGVVLVPRRKQVA